MQFVISAMLLNTLYYDLIQALITAIPLDNCTHLFRHHYCKYI